MNREELRKRLESEGFNKTIYSLDGDCSFEGYCLDYSHGTWRVYYFERGTTYDEDLFKNEEDACLSFYNRISSDAVAKK